MESDLVVSPPVGNIFLGTADIAKVEFLLFGYERQTLTAPNKELKHDARRMYTFVVPDSFLTKPQYACDKTHLSEVRITDVNGLVLSKTFELCPPLALEITAEVVG